MVQNNPINYAYLNQYGAYNNTGANLNNNYAYEPTLYNTQPIQQDTYTPQFAGNQQEEEPKKKGLFGKIVGVGVAIGGAILLKKHWSSISKWAKGLFNKGSKEVATASHQKAQKLIEKHADRVPVAKTSLKHKVKNTSINPNPKPITNAKEAKIIENINLSHVDGNTRRMVEKAAAGTVTPAQQKAYDKAIAYKAPNAEQKAAINKLHSANAAQRAELNSIANNSKGAGNLAKVEAGIKAEAKAAKALTNGSIRHANGNIYHIENGAVTKVELYQNGVKNTVELTDPKKIAKHLAKHNVNTADLIPQKNINMVA